MPSAPSDAAPFCRISIGLVGVERADVLHQEHERIRIDRRIEVLLDLGGCGRHARIAGHAADQRGVCGEPRVVEVEHLALGR